jgi:rare lipoprotein A
MTVIRTYLAALLVLSFVAAMGWAVLVQDETARGMGSDSDLVTGAIANPERHAGEKSQSVAQLADAKQTDGQVAPDEPKLSSVAAGLSDPCPNCPVVALDFPKPAIARLHAIAATASIYSHTYHGRKTASGERFDMHALTAAHKSLPFGTYVRVTNRSNGKSVIVRINDRGPFVKGRAIDLSVAAARSVGMRGLAQVSLAVVR